MRRGIYKKGDVQLSLLRSHGFLSLLQLGEKVGSRTLTEIHHYETS